MSGLEEGKGETQLRLYACPGRSQSSARLRAVKRLLLSETTARTQSERDGRRVSCVGASVRLTPLQQTRRTMPERD